MDTPTPMSFYTISAECGQVGQTLGAAFFKTTLPNLPMTLVHAVAWSTVDDAGLTLQIQDDGSNMLTTALDISDTDAAPAEWKSKHVGGTNTPVQIAGGSILTLDAANAAADTRIQFVLTFLC